MNHGEGTQDENHRDQNTQYTQHDEGTTRGRAVAVLAGVEFRAGRDGRDGSGS